MDFLRDVPEATGDEPDDAELKAPKIYEPIPSLDYLAEKLQMFMQQYNETIRGSKMDLVFFKVLVPIIILILKVLGLLHLLIRESYGFLSSYIGDNSEWLARYPTSLTNKLCKAKLVSPGCLCSHKLFHLFAVPHLFFLLPCIMQSTTHLFLQRTL